MKKSPAFLQGFSSCISNGRCVLHDDLLRRRSGLKIVWDDADHAAAGLWINFDNYHERHPSDQGSLLIAPRKKQCPLSDCEAGLFHSFLLSPFDVLTFGSGAGGFKFIAPGSYPFRLLHCVLVFGSRLLPSAFPFPVTILYHIHGYMSIVFLKKHAQTYSRVFVQFAYRRLFKNMI